MKKVKYLFGKLSLRWAFVVFVAIFVISAFFMTKLTSNWAREKMLEIERMNIELYKTVEYSEKSTEYNIYFTSPSLNPNKLPEKDRKAFKWYRFLLNNSGVIWYTPAILLSALTFYRAKLKKPLEILENASNKVGAGELDFNVNYNSQDEMGRLSKNFEKMRISLAENTEKMLKMADERKIINDAYAHELRTPIAVLKGYSEMFLKFSDNIDKNSLNDGLKAMSAQIQRFEAFSEKMNAIQSLEDLAIKPVVTPVNGLFDLISKTAELLCEERGIKCNFTNNVNCGANLKIDSACVQQVFENLVKNSVRFAQKEVNISLKTENNYLGIIVSDDGKGFDSKILRNFGTPYNRGINADKSTHFGLGLYISKILCEKHGGNLSIKNTEIGAKTSAKFSLEI